MKQQPWEKDSVVHETRGLTSILVQPLHGDWSSPVRYWNGDWSSPVRYWNGATKTTTSVQNDVWSIWRDKDDGQQNDARPKMTRRMRRHDATTICVDVRRPKTTRRKRRHDATTICVDVRGSVFSSGSRAFPFQTKYSMSNVEASIVPALINAWDAGVSILLIKLLF